MSETNKNSDGRGSLRSTALPIDVPPAFDARVRSTLLERGVILETPSRSTLRRQPLAYMTIAASFLVIGFFAGRGISSPAEAATIPRYALLLYGGDTSEASRSTGRRREYGEWLRKVAAGSGSFSGEELGDEIMTLGAPIAASRNDGPLLGFFIIGANSVDEAAAIARTSPHLKYGGSMIVQRVVD